MPDEQKRYKYTMHTPILTVPQIRESEQFTMQSIPSTELMERAGTACVQAIRPLLDRNAIPQMFVICGTGNNGGDGLVIARQLALEPTASLETVTVVVCQDADSRRSPEFQENFDRWEKLGDTGRTRTLIFDGTDTLEIPGDALIVDALFGIGLHRPAAGIHALAIQAINASDAPVVAIDIPSGLFADQHTPPEHDIVMADLTLSIQFQKLALLLPEAYPYHGDVQVLDIGMEVPPTMKITREYLTAEGVHPLLRRRSPYAHKGTFGHGLLIAGSASMPGAAILAATAALRGGIGKLTLHTPAAAAQHVPGRLPEAILHPDAEEQHASRIDWNTLPANINAIAIGPGLGTHPKTVTLVKNVLDEVQVPLILDADALNILADNKTRLAFLPPHSILTPHFAEFERLAGHAADDFQRVEMARAFAQRYNTILVLKGHHTLISLPDGTQFFNSTGNSGMATAGSGDTLTGLFLALMAQGYNPVESALLGTYLHGLAGDLYAEENAPQSLIASDLPQYFGKAFRYLESNDYPK